MTLRPLAERLSRTDMLQVLAIFLAALVFVLATRWPSGPGIANEAWFSLAQTRLTLLVLIALAYGAAASEVGRAERAVTLGALLAFVALSAPLDVVTYAASYPAVPLGWSLVIPFADVAAYFGVGLALGRLATLARVRALLPIVVPAVLLVAVYVDVRLGANVLNPLTAAVRVAPQHLAVALGLAALTAAAIARGRRVTEDAP